MDGRRCVGPQEPRTVKRGWMYLDLNLQADNRSVARRILLSLLGLCAVALASLLTAPGARAADRIYWSNFGPTPSIAYANLNGDGGGGTVNTAGATLNGPHGAAIDPAADSSTGPTGPATPETPSPTPTSTAQAPAISRSRGRRSRGPTVWRSTRRPGRPAASTGPTTPTTASPTPTSTARAEGSGAIWRSPPRPSMSHAGSRSTPSVGGSTGPTTQAATAGPSPTPTSTAQATGTCSSRPHRGRRWTRGHRHRSADPQDLLVRLGRQAPDRVRQPRRDRHLCVQHRRGDDEGRPRRRDRPAGAAPLLGQLQRRLDLLGRPRRQRRPGSQYLGHDDQQPGHAVPAQGTRRDRRPRGQRRLGAGLDPRLLAGDLGRGRARVPALPGAGDPRLPVDARRR